MRGLLRWWRSLWVDDSLCWLCKHPKADHEVFASLVICNSCLKSHRDEDCWIAWAVEHE